MHILRLFVLWTNCDFGVFTIYLPNLVYCVGYSHFFEISILLLGGSGRDSLWALWGVGSVARFGYNCILICFDVELSVKLFLENLDFHTLDCKNHLAS